MLYPHHPTARGRVGEVGKLGRPPDREPGHEVGADLGRPMCLGHAGVALADRYRAVWAKRLLGFVEPVADVLDRRMVMRRSS